MKIRRLLGEHHCMEFLTPMTSKHSTVALNNLQQIHIKDQDRIRRAETLRTATDVRKSSFSSDAFICQTIRCVRHLFHRRKTGRFIFSFGRLLRVESIEYSQELRMLQRSA